MKPPSYRTPITDRAKRPMDGFADEWVPRYICEELERQRNELLEALESMLDLWQKVGGNQDDYAVEMSEKAIAKAKGETL